MMWFATGIVMMYAGGMPRLTPELRLDRLPELDMSAIRLTPAEAAERAGMSADPGRMVLLSVQDRPAYRISGFGTTTVFADSGEILSELTVQQSRAVAARFADVAEERVRYERTIDEVDQWTLGQSQQLPLHKFAVDDDAATELYVSPGTGEVTLLT